MNELNGLASVDANGLAYIEALYEEYRNDPSSVSDDWQQTFREQERGETPASVANLKRVEAELTQRARWSSSPRADKAVSAAAPSTDESWMAKQAAVLRLIQAYRILGHVKADTDPIHLRQSPSVSDLDPATFGLTEVDMDIVFNTGNLVAPDFLKLRDILSLLQETYTGSVGIEYMFISDSEQKNWLMHRAESTRA
ncbi:MAG: 2-oxoglutarate dehydrogenase E1 subunit family protein, partial [Kiritimatiellia bacterium]